jgi:hypothetical protein
MKVASMFVLASMLVATGSLYSQAGPRHADAVAADPSAMPKAPDARSVDVTPALQETRVPPDANLQAALNKGGVIRLTPGATYTGSFVLKSKTTLYAEGAQFKMVPNGPVLSIEPGTTDVYVSGFTFAGADTMYFNQQIVRIGRADSRQATADRAPARITFIGAKIPSYRGKRAIEVNGSQVTIKDSVINDVYDPAARDSQAILILNAPCSPCVIEGNDLSAGSENILVGGAATAIPGLVPTDIRITNNKIWRPLSWQTDRTNRGVKNLIELKSGINVAITHNVLDGSWKAAQDGYCMVITPRAKGEIHDVLIEDNTCDHVGGGFNITGFDEKLATPAPTSGIVVRRLRLNADHRAYGGRGILALITLGPHDVTFDDVTAITTGGCIVLVDKSGKHITADGTYAPTPSMAALTITNSRLVAGTYGLVIGPASTSTLNTGVIDTITMMGNTIAGANGWLRKYFPRNTYVTRDKLNALVAAQ